MKYRRDFVTNSSSSSFVLSFKDSSDMNDFFSYCKSNNYEEFLDMINYFASDYLIFDNNSKQSLSIRPLIDKIRHIKFPQNVIDELQKLYDNDYQIEPYKLLRIKLNDYFNGDYFNIKSLDFQNIESDVDDGEKGVCFIELENNSGHRNKERALATLKESYLIDYRQELIHKNVKPLGNNEAYIDYINRQNAYENSKEYKDSIDTFLTTSDYGVKKKEIEDAKLVINATIWDSQGGLLEWSIRNGFIEDNFRNNCVVVLNVG